MNLFIIHLLLVLMLVLKSGGGCNTIDGLYAGMCVPNKVKHMDVNVFYLKLGINETRILVQHESFECKCGLNKSVCNSKNKNGIMINVGVSVKN